MSADERTKMVADLKNYPHIDGVDYSPEGIEMLRQAMITSRDEALVQLEFEFAVTLSHVIAVLHWCTELTRYYNELNAEVTRLRALVASEKDHGASS